jgi:hypothetical protein
MKLCTFRHAFDRFDFTTFSFEPEHQTREDGSTVNQHCAGATFSKLAAMLCSR